ncbi:MAG TPA: hypothetical protein VHG72_09180 [Polyangia bacterium]|nr:hypothetical protein [Polyangia bacterium]
MTCNVTTGTGGSGTGTGGTMSSGGTGGTTGTTATGGTAGGSATGGAAGAAGGTPGQACAGTAPWTTASGDVQIVVNAGQKGQPWSRFYEMAVASDHANTILSTAYGRNSQGAIKKAHDQAGFQYIRFHGILDSDIGVYGENNGTPVYTWTRFDQVYDAITGAGMRPIVEISFTPPSLASSNMILTNLWYNNVSPNISKPADWTKWENFMQAIVQHLEGRYGVAEVQGHWFFEVWNEPSWMYQGGDAGYNELYMHTARGLLAGDPLVKVGGPAGSAGETPGLLSGLVSYTKSNNLKLDFVSWHRYANDNGGAYADANVMASFYDSLMQNTINASGFKGLVINDEWGACYDANVVRDTEVSASFIAKTVHLIGTDAAYGPPYMFGWWAISDLYEEFNTGSATAFRDGGNFGLMLKGDPQIPASFDVPKPAFNAFRLLHLMGDTRVSTTGGTTSDGVNAVATVSNSGNAVQVLVYNHVNGGGGNSASSSQVKITVNNIPGTGTFTVRHYMLDRTHANSYQAWVGMGKPSNPSASQWTQLSAAADLCYYETTGTGTTWTATFPENVYSVSLIVLSR